MARNILNVEDVELFLRSQAGEGADPLLSDYLVLALKRAFLKEERFFEPVIDYPDPAPAWLTAEKFRQDECVRFNPRLTEMC